MNIKTCLLKKQIPVSQYEKVDSLPLSGFDNDDLRNYNGYKLVFENVALFRIIKKGGVVIWVVGKNR